MDITIKKVAEKANVSKTTVSKFLNGGNVRSPYKEQIEEVIKKFNYRPNIIAKALKTKRTYTVGVLVPYINDIFSADIVSAIEKQLRVENYSLLVSSYENDRTNFRKNLELMMGQMIDSLIVFPSGITAEDLAPALNHRPLVLVDRSVRGVDVNTVMVDHVNAGYIACKYLLSMGHKKIAFLVGSKKSHTLTRRLEGCMRALVESNIDIGKCLFKYDYGSARDIKDILNADEQPTAIFALSYYITIEALKNFNTFDVDIPNRISFLAFDDHELYKLYKTPLTVVAQPLNDLGKHAAQMTLDGLDEEKENFLRTEKLEACIIERNSVIRIN